MEVEGKSWIQRRSKTIARIQKDSHKCEETTSSLHSSWYDILNRWRWRLGYFEQIKFLSADIPKSFLNTFSMHFTVGGFISYTFQNLYLRVHNLNSEVVPYQIFVRIKDSIHPIIEWKIHSLYCMYFQYQASKTSITWQNYFWSVKWPTKTGPGFNVLLDSTFATQENILSKLAWIWR